MWPLEGEAKREREGRGRGRKKRGGRRSLFTSSSSVVYFRVCPSSPLHVHKFLSALHVTLYILMGVSRSYCNVLSYLPSSFSLLPSLIVLLLFFIFLSSLLLLPLHPSFSISLSTFHPSFFSSPIFLLLLFNFIFVIIFLVLLILVLHFLLFLFN